MPTVKRTIDLSRPGTLSDEEKTRYDALPDDRITYDETPDMGDVDWSKLRVEHPKRKPTVTMRLPEDVIEFFKADGGKGYTQRIAAVITAYARSQQPRKSE